jgi:Protein of unknown function (DUF1639)
MVISSEGPTSTSTSASASSQTKSPVSLPPSSEFAFSKRYPLRFHSQPRTWNLRSRNGSLAFDPNERRRFAVALSGEEIAEDVYAVTGSMPRRRPKKRPRVVQKQIDV